jgi:putative membrane protein
LVPAFLATLAIGLLNALVRPILFVFKIITLPLSIVTLGLFALLVSFAMNVIIFYAVGHSGWIGGFSVPGFLAAVKAGFVMSVINAVLTWLVPGRERRA